ncbi:MAG: methylmalonyl Co-A mutase-associated GTPase MeaB [Bacteroidia bacterium]|nr:methylmalonyl Co-A mutase-associated GTPase MeaB [Bacteroidia bacterium]
MAKEIKNINPGFRKGRGRNYTLEECIQGVKHRHTDVLSFLISKAESHLDVDQAFVQNVISETSIKEDCRIIAVSGSPGVGKSTFLNSIGADLLHRSHNIAILPVDPSSRISKGSILGDKTRMEDIAHKPGCFIRPTSSSSSLGGVAPSTSLAVSICQRAGFDYIFIETVGVGQSEYEVRFLVDCFILLLQPGGGDDLQGIKRGIMEMADIVIVNKSDGELLNKARLSYDAYNTALKLMLPNKWGWKTKALMYSSVDHTGRSKEIFSLIDKYFSQLINEGNLFKVRISNSMIQFEKYSADILLKAILKDRKVSSYISDLSRSLKDGKSSMSECLFKLKEFVKNVYG